MGKVKRLKITKTPKLSLALSRMKAVIGSMRNQLLGRCYIGIELRQEYEAAQPRLKRH